MIATIPPGSAGASGRPSRSGLDAMASTRRPGPATTGRRCEQATPSAVRRAGDRFSGERHSPPTLSSVVTVKTRLLAPGRWPARAPRSSRLSSTTWTATVRPVSCRRWPYGRGVRSRAGTTERRIDPASWAVKLEPRAWRDPDSRRGRRSIRGRASGGPRQPPRRSHRTERRFDRAPDLLLDLGPGPSPLRGRLLCERPLGPSKAAEHASPVGLVPTRSSISKSEAGRQGASDEAVTKISAEQRTPSTDSSPRAPRARVQAYSR